MITNQPSDAIIQPSSHKLFFALWPDEDTRAALARLQPQVPGRAIAPAKLHLTLAFLGLQPGSALAPLLAILDGLTVPALRLRVDMLGYFQRPRIAWAGMTAAAPALSALQAGLMAQLEAAGFPAATHGEFKPHITLAREARSAPADIQFAPIPWHARQVALVESFPDGSYMPIAAKHAPLNQ